jgi:hypothetical protein
MGNKSGRRATTSRRRATTSRRRITMAAGALLAGAAIPIAAAGTAWADDTDTPNQTENVGQLERQGLTTDQALAVVHAERHDIAVAVSYDGTTVVDANQGGTSGDASATTSVGSTKDVAAAIGGNSDATATGGPNDRAFATNGGDATVRDATDSKATATNGGVAAVESNGEPGTVSNDLATAHGANSQATIENTFLGGSGGTVTHDVATGSGGGDAFVLGDSASGTLSHDTATASGSSSQAYVDNFGVSPTTTSDAAHAYNGGEAVVTNDVTGVASHDVAIASGSGEAGGQTAFSLAEIANDGRAPVSHDTATATNGGYGFITLDQEGSTVAVSHDTAIGNSGDALVTDAGSSRATAVNTGPANFTSINGGSFNGVSPGASVSYATDSTAKADGAGSQAAVSGNPTSTDGYITDSHAIDTNGTSTIVITSDTLEIMGIHSAVTPEVVSGPSGGETVVTPVHVEMTPLADVHVMPAMPLP